MGNDLRIDIVLHRLSGATFPAIAMLLDIEVSKVRYYCKRAVKSGVATIAQMRLKPTTRPLRISVEAYDAHWLSLVSKRTVVNDDGCHIWQGSVHPRGYGLIMYRSRAVRVHRKMFEVVNGVQLVESDYVCHRCDVKLCSNIGHLFLGDAKINAADMTAKGRHHEQSITQCPRGHAYDAVNTYFAPNGARGCKICMRARTRLKLGWPEELAYSTKTVPPGYSREVIV